jgi:DNA-binding transcriptional MocR family regulator
LVNVVPQFRISGKTAQGIAASIEEGIERGALAPGSRLPSIRRLAADRGVSPTTAAAALGILRRRGLVLTRPRSGARVSWRGPARRRWPAIVAPGTRDLARGNPDPGLLPALAPALAQIDSTHRLYGQEPAEERLLQLAAVELDENGIPSGHLVVTSGALDAIERIVSAHLRPGDVVVVEDPSYPAVFDLLRARGLALHPVAVDEEGAVPESLERALQDDVSAVILTPRGHNPTGAAFTRERAAELSSILASRPEVMVIEDDYLGSVAGTDRFTTVRARSRWATVRSVSKSLGPDLRLAVVSGDRQTINQVQSGLLLGPQWVSHILQRLVVVLWSDSDVAIQLKHAAATYTRRRKALVDSLAGHGICAQAPSGLNVWIRVPDEGEVMQYLLEQGFAVALGSPFSIAPAGGAIRVTISSLEEAEIPRLASLIAQSLDSGQRTRAA